MNQKQGLTKNLIAFLLIAVTLALVFLTNRAVVFMMDDLWYSTVLSDETPITGLSDIFHAQVWHYFNWGGRSMTHTILQLTLLAGETAADILNTVVTLILSWVVFAISLDFAEIEKKDVPLWEKLVFLSLIVGALHGFNANWELSMYWQSGSANYLYVTVFIMLFVFMYMRELSDTEPKPLKGAAVFMIPLSVLAGWSNENMGPTAWLISVFTIVRLKKKKRTVHPWMIEGSVLCLLGSIACIAAPGNFVRSDTAETTKGLLWTLYLRMYQELRAGFGYLFPALLAFLFLAVIWYGIMKNKPDVQTIVLFAAAVVSVGAMILSPHYPDRATFGSMTFLMIAAFTLVLKIIKSRRDSAPWLFAAGITVWLHGMYYLAEYLGMMWGWIE